MNDYFISNLLEHFRTRLRLCPDEPFLKFNIAQSRDSLAGVDHGRRDCREIKNRGRRSRQRIIRRIFDGSGESLNRD
jgi:hypothetical protein